MSLKCHICDEIVPSAPSFHRRFHGRDARFEMVETTPVSRLEPRASATKSSPLHPSLPQGRRRIVLRWLVTSNDRIGLEGLLRDLGIVEAPQELAARRPWHRHLRPNPQARTPALRAGALASSWDQRANIFWGNLSQPFPGGGAPLAKGEGEFSGR